jgi:hypothetical protein
MTNNEPRRASVLGHEVTRDEELNPFKQESLEKPGVL